MGGGIDVWSRGGGVYWVGEFYRWRGGNEQIFAWWGDPRPSDRVGKTLMFDYLTKTSVINLMEFTVNSINCIVWESDLSIRTSK